jgi:hypothetical protein
MKPGKSINGEQPSTDVAKGSVALLKSLRGRFNGYPMKRGMFQGKPKRKTP